MTTTGKIALFVGGTLFGSAGFKLLGGKDARKVYTHATAAVLRCRDQVMRDVEAVQEGCSDILADAKAINEASFRFFTKAGGASVCGPCSAP